MKLMELQGTEQMKIACINVLYAGFSCMTDSMIEGVETDYKAFYSALYDKLQPQTYIYESIHMYLTGEDIASIYEEHEQCEVICHNYNRISSLEKVKRFSIGVLTKDGDLRISDDARDYYTQMIQFYLTKEIHAVISLYTGLDIFINHSGIEGYVRKKLSKVRMGSLEMPDLSSWFVDGEIFNHVLLSGGSCPLSLAASLLHLIKGRKERRKDRMSGAYQPTVNENIDNLLSFQTLPRDNMKANAVEMGLYMANS